RSWKTCFNCSPKKWRPKSWYVGRGLSAFVITRPPPAAGATLGAVGPCVGLSEQDASSASRGTTIENVFIARPRSEERAACAPLAQAGARLRAAFPAPERRTDIHRREPRPTRSSERQVACIGRSFAPHVRSRTASAFDLERECYAPGRMLVV